jgi:molybdopterin-synthase adenylyltransferase
MTDSERDRYSRQILVDGVGSVGQERILAASVAIVGCGALGAFQAGALARTGVGHIRLIDRDFVEWSNLQRQWLYDEQDAREGCPKAVAAARKLALINSGVRAEPVVADLTPENAGELLGEASLILDGTDNFETRYLINDFAVARSVPWIYGGAVGSYGLAMPIFPGRSACLECVYPEPPRGEQKTCETSGVLNTVTSMVASWQASLAFRILAAGAEGIEPRMTTFDVWSPAVRHVAVPRRDPACPSCGLRSYRHLLGKERTPISLCGRNAVQIHDRRRAVDLPSLAARLSPLGEVRSNDFALRFCSRPYELTIFPDGRAIIKGTTDPAIARSLYSKYVGN